MEIEIVTLSRQGGRSYNEDVHGHWHDERYVACLVADGAGGHGGGDVAAATARSSMLGGFSRSPSVDPNDARMVLLELTATGRATVEAMRTRGPDVTAKTLAPLTAEEADMLKKLVGKLG